MDLKPFKTLREEEKNIREEEKNNGTKSEERRVVSQTIVSNKRNERDERNESGIIASKIKGSGFLQEPDFNKRKELDYIGQWKYLLFENRLSQLIILIFLVLWAVSLGLIYKEIYAVSGIGIVAILVDMAWISFSLWGIYLMLSQTKDIPQLHMGIPTFLGTPFTLFVMKEGKTLFIPGILSHHEINVAVIPVNKPLEKVKTSGGAYCTVIYSFAVAPIHVALLEYRDKGGKDVVDVVDGSFGRVIKRKLNKVGLEEAQSLEDDLLIEISEEIFDSLAPKTWRKHNDEWAARLSSENKYKFLVTADSPINLYSRGVAISVLRIDDIKPSEDIINAQEDMVKETYQRVSEIKDTYTVIEQTMIVIRSMKLLGVESKKINPMSVLNTVLEDRNIKSGKTKAMTAPGLQNLWSSISSAIPGISGMSDKIDIEDALSKFAEMSETDLKRNIASIQEMIQELEKKSENKKGGSKK